MDYKKKYLKYKKKYLELKGGMNYIGDYLEDNNIKRMNPNAPKPSDDIKNRREKIDEKRKKDELKVEIARKNVYGKHRAEEECQKEINTINKRNYDNISLIKNNHYKKIKELDVKIKKLKEKKKINFYTSEIKMDKFSRFKTTNFESKNIILSNLYEIVHGKTNKSLEEIIKNTYKYLKEISTDKKKINEIYNDFNKTLNSSKEQFNLLKENLE